jgi:hypothetical protein
VARDTDDVAVGVISGLSHDVRFTPSKTGLTFADLIRRKGVKERSCSPAYLATKRRAATPEVEKLQIRAAMKATPIPRSDLIMLTRLSH